MSTLRSLALPANSRQLLTWDVTGDSDLRRIRTGIEQFFRTGNAAASGKVAERIALVATELTGNALRHGAPPIVVRLLLDDDCYLLDVRDAGLQGVPTAAEPGGPFRAGGRGLIIAGTLAQQLCWYQDTTAKHVWASFPAGPHEPPPDADHRS